MKKEAKIYNGEKTVSSTSDSGKTRQLHVQQWDQNILSYHIQNELNRLKDLNVRHVTIKLLEENIGRILFDINHSNIFLDQSPKAKEIAKKKKKKKCVCVVHLFKLSFFHIKVNHQQSEKTTYEMEENICKWCDWLAINLQNIQTAHTV